MKKLFLLIAVFFFVAQVTCFAAINVSNLTGSIKITAPDGTSIIVEAGQPIPAIAEGSSIEIVTGTADINATDASTVSVSVGGNILTVASGSSVTAGLDATGLANISVASGSATLKTTDGKTAALNTGNAVSVALTDGASTISVSAGEDITVIGVDNQTTVVKSEGSTENEEIKAEGYTPPAVQNTPNLEVEVESEETAKDISPIS